jgi:hypothetical protein
MSGKYYSSSQRFEFMRSIMKKNFEDKHITEEQLKQWYEYIDKCKADDMKVSENNSPSLEKDLRYSEEISNKCKKSDIYSQNLYAALCNNEFIKNNQIWSCSWRSSGGIVANLREQGDYIDWYCSGIGTTNKKYVAESVVTDEVFKDIDSLGWKIIHHETDII